MHAMEDDDASIETRSRSNRRDPMSVTTLALPGHDNDELQSEWSHSVENIGWTTSPNPNPWLTLRHVFPLAAPAA